MRRHQRLFRVSSHLLAAAWAAWLPVVGLRVEGGDDALFGRSYWSVSFVIGFGLPEEQP